MNIHKEVISFSATIHILRTTKLLNKLADVLTRCCSDSQGKSEERYEMIVINRHSCTCMHMR